MGLDHSNVGTVNWLSLDLGHNLEGTGAEMMSWAQFLKDWGCGGL